jgi:hypothetical protein
MILFFFSSLIKDPKHQMLKHLLWTKIKYHLLCIYLITLYVKNEF